MSDMKENLELLSRSLYRLPVVELTDEQLHAVVARTVLARCNRLGKGRCRPIVPGGGRIIFLRNICWARRCTITCFAPA